MCFDDSYVFPVAPHSGCSWLLKALVQAGNIARVPGRLTCPHADWETNLGHRAVGEGIHKRPLHFYLSVCDLMLSGVAYWFCMLTCRCPQKRTVSFYYYYITFQSNFYILLNFSFVLAILKKGPSQGELHASKEKLTFNHWIVDQNSRNSGQRTWLWLRLVWRCSNINAELMQACLFSVSSLSFSTLTFTHVQSTLCHCPELWDLSAHFFLSSFVWLSRGGKRFGFVYVGGVWKIWLV